jgi:hypothetical protein
MMSPRLRYGHFWLTAIWAGLVVATGSALAQSRDDQNDAKAHLEEVRRLNEVAAQRVQADVAIALKQAMRLAVSDPAQALEALKKLLTNLEDDTTLSSSRRDALVRQIKARIRQVEVMAKRTNVNRDSAQTVPAPVVHRPAPEAPDGSPVISAALAEIRTLQKSGNLNEAKRRLAELEGRYPDNPALTAARRTLTAQQIANSARDLENDSQRGFGAAIQDMTHSSIPPTDNVEYPKDWQEKTKKRASTVRLTDKERTILKALNTVVSLKFKDTKFDEVIDQIANAIKQPILIDKAALAEAQVNYDTPVTEQTPAISARTLLRKILGEFNLTYVIKDEAIQVTSAQKAKDLMIVRTYYIGDLLSNGWTGTFFGFPTGLEFPLQLGATPLQIAQEAKQLSDVIVASIDPMSWKEHGGLGTITFNPPTSSLIIKQSAEVHALLTGGMRP